ncbi:MAG: asparagine synthase (glutamine-hydrolyzing) [Victivallales bacterium]|nr:asparagine synthase (glutamine-hydrolyzing) [Victivallales bacterium]
MCGIFGWIVPESERRNAIKPYAERLSMALKHRGPNDAGYAAFNRGGRRFTEKDPGQPEECMLLLGQTRLSIIDLSSAGHQPMHSPDGRYTLVFNGEIYNYVELRRELESEGIPFVSKTDSEVLLHWVIRHGREGLSRLNGMFAFALYDVVTNTLFCARDFFGIKPFYYYKQTGAFCFASELPALLEFPGVPRRVCPQMAYSYLCFGQYDMGSKTFLKGVNQLSPGHCININLGNPEAAMPESFWRPDLTRRSVLSFADAADRVREVFLNNVRLHLRSDVPLGVALSGGIDSSAVTCAVRHLEPDAEIHTFSFVARGSEVSEEPWIKRVAAHAGVISHMVELEPLDLVNDLDSMIRNLGEPFGSTSIYAQRRVFQLAQECGVTVTLDGQGADELFGGYQGYPGPRIASMLLRGQLLDALRFFNSTTAWPDRPRGEVLRRVLREFTPDSLMAMGMKIAGRNPAPLWMDCKGLKEAGIQWGLISDQKQLYSGRDRMLQTLAYQLTWHGLPQLLRHGDRNSMAFSIESRVPFLTRDMAELALSLPESYLVAPDGCSKAVFRAAMRGIVPDEVLDRRDKIGFATPERQWLLSLSKWVDKTLDEAEDVPYMKMDKIREEWQNVCSGRSAFDWRVWRWINYIRWVEIFSIKS